MEFSASDVYKSAVLTHQPETTANTDSGWITSASYTRMIPADHYARMQFERLDGAVMTAEDITAIAESLKIYCGYKDLVRRRHAIRGGCGKVHHFLSQMG